MSMAPAKNVPHCLPDVGFARLGIPVEIRLRGHDDAIHAKPALHPLFIAERFLYRVRLLARAQSFERRNFCTGCARDGRYARSHRLSLHDDRATSALTQTTSELRPAQCKIIA